MVANTKHFSWNLSSNVRGKSSHLWHTYTVHRMTRSTSYPRDSSMLESRTLHLRMTVCRRSGNVKRRVPGTSSSSQTDTITNWTEIRLRQMNTWKRREEKKVRSPRSTVCLSIHSSDGCRWMDTMLQSLTWEDGLMKRGLAAPAPSFTPLKILAILLVLVRRAE